MNNYAVPPQRIFEAEVDRNFSFLVQEYGFVKVNSEESASNPSMYVKASYENTDLNIWIENDRGSFETVIHVKKDFPWLRPYMSHIFYLNHIVNAIAPGEVEELRSAILGGNLTTAEECRIIVEFEARCLKKYCAPVLSRDYQLLQQISGKSTA